MGDPHAQGSHPHCRAKPMVWPSVRDKLPGHVRQPEKCTPVKLLTRKHTPLSLEDPLAQTNVPQGGVQYPGGLRGEQKEVMESFRTQPRRERRTLHPLWETSSSVFSKGQLAAFLFSFALLFRIWLLRTSFEVKLQSDSDCTCHAVSVQLWGED